MTAIRARSLVAQVYDEVLRRIGSGGRLRALRSALQNLRVT